MEQVWAIEAMRQQGEKVIEVIEVIEVMRRQGEKAIEVIEVMGYWLWVLGYWLLEPLPSDRV